MRIVFVDEYQGIKAIVQRDAEPFGRAQSGTRANTGSLKNHGPAFWF
jgi:hypothetical protein